MIEIRFVDGFFIVLSPSGRILGGPYATLDEAISRRTQCESHAAKDVATEKSA